MSSIEPASPAQPERTPAQLESLAPLPAPKLTRFASAAALLFGEGASIGLFTWTVLHSRQLTAYLRQNSLSPGDRKELLLLMAAAALAWLVAGSALFWWRRGGSLDRLWRAALRLSPLAIAGALPLLFDWAPWEGLELTYLVLAGSCCLLLERAVTASLAAGPSLLPFPAAEASRRLIRAAVRTLSERPGLAAALVGMAASGYAAYFAFHTIQGHWRFATSAFDLGIENNLVWNASQLGSFFKTSPLGGPTASHAGFHQTYFSYLLALPYRLWPKPELLLALQALCVGAAAVPLFVWAQRRVGPWVACLLALAYLLYPPVHGANLYDFHYQPLAPFFLWTTLCFADRRRWIAAAVFALITLSLREDMGALLLVAGAYLILSGEHPKFGALLAGGGTVAFVLLKFVLMPRFLDGVSAYIHQYRDLLPEGDKGFGGVLKTVFGNPGFTLTTLLEREKVVYLLQLFSPLAFLPLRNRMAFLFCAPGFFFTLLETKYPALVQTSFQYTAYWTLLLFPACAHAFRALETRKRWPLVAALALSIGCNTVVFGSVVQQNTARSAFGKYRFGLTAEDRQRHADAYVLIAKTPPTAKVAASEFLNPHVSSRPDAYALRLGLFDAEYVLFDVPMLRSDERAVIRSALVDPTFGVVEERGDFVLLRRGADAGKNGALLTRLSP
ncbi:MAG: DUF2079 domain-containing protein [Myxococcales bacterium]|nr:DUF2079 domain-containing protein [Myxococcales bacterium]